ncbi:MAG: NAD(+) synthase [Clostridia bacterium]|nr:NAD(+) synthase [Clostridia bacterium]
MKHGYIRVCAATPDIRVADCIYNADNIITKIREAAGNSAKLIVFPELCITAYTCGDLFLQRKLISSAKEQLTRIADETSELDIVSVIGLPMIVNHSLYNCAAVIHKGRILGVVPKKNIPNYSEFYEKRHFAEAEDGVINININNQTVPFGTNILFCAENITEFVFAIEICEDLWVPDSPSISHAIAGATVIANLSASDEVTGKSHYREDLVCIQSAKLFCAYVYADAGEGESTTDLVFSGHNLIAENGAVLAKAERFQNSAIYAEIDTHKLSAERTRTITFKRSNASDYTKIYFSLNEETYDLTREINKTPFVPSSDTEREKRCEEILTIQSMGLKKRILHSGAKTAVLGISGGLDSTLALLVTTRAFDSLGLERRNILAITMPCFGTTDRTYNNAVAFSKSLGVTLMEIPINKAVLTHFEDIGQNPDTHDVTYENSQARERTQILMDIANKTEGLVVGTGDLSELALGWATYNGDHMSMYAVNASVPKTLIRYLVDYEANRTDNDMLRKTLVDILNTPVSPELLPPKDGEISQKTEHIVGPYELHDFFLYYTVRFGFPPSKVFRLAKYAFREDYEPDFILSWLKVFYKRFFSQQFKRSCLPDAPKVGTVALSPRGDWRMPSDAAVRLWMDEIENMYY